MWGLDRQVLFQLITLWVLVIQVLLYLKYRHVYYLIIFLPSCIFMSPYGVTAFNTAPTIKRCTLYLTQMAVWLYFLYLGI